MKVSAAGRKAIAAHEGVRLKAYADPATGGEPWTIGVGHTSAAGPPKVTKGMTITAAECDEILSRDLATFERAVLKVVTAPLSQNQFDALVSLAFNIGASNLSKSTLIKKLNARDYRGAADQFTVWNKAAGKVMNGLVKRRADERALFLKADRALIERITAPESTPERIAQNTAQPVVIAKPSVASPLQSESPPAVIVRDEPTKPSLLQRLSRIFGA